MILGHFPRGLPVTARCRIRVAANRSAWPMTAKDSPDRQRNPLLAAVADALRACRPSRRIAPGSFPAGLRRALAGQRAEIDAVAADSEPANFEYGIGAIERSGRGAEAGRQRLLQPCRRAYQRRAAGGRARDGAGSRQAPQRHLHEREALFRRVDALHVQRQALGLTSEQKRVLDRYHTIFVRAGARLGARARRASRRSPSGSRASAPSSRRTCWQTRKPTRLVLDGEADLAGLPSFLREAAAQAAAEAAGLPAST